MTCGIRGCRAETALTLRVDGVPVPLCWVHWTQYSDQPLADGRAWLHQRAAASFGPPAVPVKRAAIDLPAVEPPASSTRGGR